VINPLNPFGGESDMNDKRKSCGWLVSAVLTSFLAVASAQDAATDQAAAADAAVAERGGAGAAAAEVAAEGFPRNRSSNSWRRLHFTRMHCLHNC
jgi:hypothetical protein